MSDSMFICLVCGKVYPKTCPTCPDRGDGRGCTVAHIKDSLRRCTNNAEVTNCADHFYRERTILRRAGGDAGVMALQINNLIQHMRDSIRAGAG